MRQTTSYWHTGVPLIVEPLRRNLTADVAVVGAGMAGLSAAARLLDAAPGLDVLVVDAHFPGYGASGRNAGIVEAPLAMPLWLLKGALPEPEGRWALPALYRSVEHEIAAVTGLGAAADIEPSRVLIGASSRLGEETLRLAHHQLADSGVPVGWLAPEEMEGATGHSGFGGLDARGYQVNPMALAHALARAVEHRGARTCWETPVVRITRGGAAGIEMVTTTGATIRSKQAVVCTGAWTKALDAPGRPSVHPMGTYMVATRPLTDEELSRIGGAHSSVSRVFSMSYRRVHEHRLLFGGGGRSLSSADSVPADDRRYIDRVAKVLRQDLPWLAEVELVQGWGGPTSATARGTPVVTRDAGIPGLVYSAGFHAFGLALLAGRMVQGLVLGDSHADAEAERLRRAFAATRLPLWEGLKAAAGAVRRTLFRGQPAAASPGRPA